MSDGKLSKDISWGLLVTDIMESKGLIQGDLADRLNVTQQSISQWVTGARKPNNFARRRLRTICNKLNINICDYKTTKNTSCTMAININEGKNELSKIEKINHIRIQLKELTKSVNILADSLGRE